MDLQTQPPRSPRSLFAGVMGLGRTTDKARAFLAGTLGEYHYGYECPHDWAVFHVLGMDGAKYATMVDRLGDDARIEAWVKEAYLDRLSPDAIRAWNDDFVRIGPDFLMEKLPDGNPLKNLNDEIFAGIRERIAPGRHDIRTVVQLLEIEDGHESMAR